MWVRAVDDSGRIGWGEGVPLFGYSEETLDLVFDEISVLASRINGLASDHAWDAVRRAKESPTAVSAVATALDMLDFPVPESMRFPLVAPLSADDLDTLLPALRKALSAGFRHLKIKTGRDVEKDIAAREMLETCPWIPVGVTFRYDANQAYSLEEAMEFCSVPASERVLWLEQPLHRKDWEGMAQLCSATAFPFMLDESIYTEEDILRAKAIGCRAIKLKLQKHRGIMHCIRMAELADSLGLSVTMGNGVSTDLGNLPEALVHERCAGFLVQASECNGYLKLAENLLYAGLGMDRGDLTYALRSGLYDGINQGGA